MDRKCVGTVRVCSAPGPEGTLFGEGPLYQEGPELKATILCLATGTARYAFVEFDGNSLPVNLNVECMQTGELHLVIPFTKEQLLEAVLDAARRVGGKSWRDRPSLL
jgi:hypothetical protein